MRTRGLPATKTTLPSKALNQDRGPNKEFPRQKKSKRIYLHQTSSARDAKGAAVRKERKREEHRYKELVMNKYLSIITLNVNGLNAPIKRHRIAEWIRKQDHTYAAYKRPISGQKTYTD